MNSQRPRSLLIVIHHSIVTYHIYFQGGKKPSKGHEVDESKREAAKLSNASKTQDAKKEKLKEKGYKEKSKLSPKVMDQYRKEGKSYKNVENAGIRCVSVLKRHKAANLQTRHGQYSYM